MHSPVSVRRDEAFVGTLSAGCHRRRSQHMDALPSAARMWLEPGQVTEEGQHSGNPDTTPSEGTPTQLLCGLWPRPWGTLQTCGCTSRGCLGPKLKAAMSRAPECPQLRKACATTGPQPELLLEADPSLQAARGALPPPRRPTLGLNSTG